jgi:hypothetical protein
VSRRLAHRFAERVTEADTAALRDEIDGGGEVARLDAFGEQCVDVGVGCALGSFGHLHRKSVPASSKI